MKQQKNYYAILPANVRYHLELTPNAKLLFAEITALTNEKGYCFASNAYFAKLYAVSNKSISRWIKQLETLGFIEIKYTYKKDTKEVEQRLIKLTLVGGDKIVRGVGTKLSIGGDKNVPDNNIYNIYNNNNINNKLNYIPENPNSVPENPKTEKSFKDFHALVQKSYFAIVDLFPPETRPKTTHEKRKWVTLIDDLWRLDKYHPRKVFLLCQKARKDEFWKNQFLTILKLRRRNKEGIKYIDFFDLKFGNDLKNVNFD